LHGSKTIESKEQERLLEYIRTIALSIGVYRCESVLSIRSFLCGFRMVG
jgi:hypothetical protein